MHLMLQQPEPDDYVIGSGETHLIRDFADLAFKAVGLDYQDYVRTDAQFIRPAEVDYLLADASKASEKLGWQPTVSFPELVRMMVESDLQNEAKAS